MDVEIISEVQVLPTHDLVLSLQSGGKPMYQYVYRAAAGVSWDQNIRGFKSTEPREWNYAQWFKHIYSVVSSEMGIELKLTKSTVWTNVRTTDQIEIEAQHAL